MPDFGGLGNHLVEDRHEHVEPLDREPCLAGEGPVQELLERLDVRQPVEQSNRIDRIVRRAIPGRLDHLAQPFPFLRNEDVRDVVARRRTVNRPQTLDDIPHRVCALGHGTIEQRRRKRAKVGFSDAVRLGPKRGIAHRPAAKRIDFGREVAVTPNRLREVDGADHEVRAWRTRAACRRGVERVRSAPLDGGGASLEERARLIVNRRRIGAEAIVKLEGGGGVDALKVFPIQRHTAVSSRGADFLSYAAVPRANAAPNRSDALSQRSYRQHVARRT